MNPYLNKLMPEWLHKWLRQLRARLWLIKESQYNIHRQLKYSSTFNNDKEAKLAALMVMTHVLEKGITMPERRMGFGQERVRDILSHLKEITYQWGYESMEVQSTLADLKQYLEIHQEADYELPGDILKGIQEQIRHLNIQDENCYGITKADYFKATSDFAKFAHSRHSVRWFTKEPVDNDKLMAAIKLAQTAPSACNRQATKVKIIASEEGKKLCCSIQNGTRGFGDKADKWLLITTETGAWSHMHHTSGILDGGIFLMNLLYALHYYGIVACPLNAHLSIEDKKVLQLKLGYPSSETPVAFVVIGNAPDKFMIPKSRRLTTDEIVQWV